MELFSVRLRMLLLFTALFCGICSVDVIGVNSVTEDTVAMDTVAMAVVDKDNNFKQPKLKDFPFTAGHRSKRRYSPSQVSSNNNYNARITESDWFKDLCSPNVDDLLKICLCHNYTLVCSPIRNSFTVPPYGSRDSTHVTSSGFYERKCENIFSSYTKCTRSTSGEEIDARERLSKLCLAIQEYYPFKTYPYFWDHCLFRDDITCCMPQLWTSTQASKDPYFTSPPSTRAAPDTGLRSATSNTIEETHAYTVKTSITSSTSSNITASNRSDQNQTTYIIAGVTTSCAFILIIIVTFILVIKLRRQSPETNVSLSSRAMNISAWIRAQMPGNVNRDSPTADWFFRGKQQEQPTTESSVASVATGHNPASVSGNSTCGDMHGSRGDENLYNTPNLIRQNTYTEYGIIAGTAGEYSSLDEVSKYNHVYADLSKMDPNSRPAMPLPAHAKNQPTPYYSVARPHSSRPASQNTIDTNEILSEYEASQYVELLDENTVISQPINTNDYLIPLPPPMVFENTQPNSYIIIIAGND